MGKGSLLCNIIFSPFPYLNDGQITQNMSANSVLDPPYEWSWKLYTFHLTPNT